jgi:hypothetical protein
MRRRYKLLGVIADRRARKRSVIAFGVVFGKGVRTVIGAVIVVFNWSKFEDFQKSVNVVNAAKAEALKGRVADVCIYLLLQ